MDLSRIGKIFGCISLICGTAIGAGMLTLPISTANCGFWPSIVGFLITWVFMAISSLLLLEVNLIFKNHPNTDLIYLSKVTLGLYGQIFTTIVYLVLLYSLLSAYLTGCAGWLKFIPDNYAWISWLLTIIITSIIISFGIRSADIVNRFLSIGLIISYFILLFFANYNTSHDINLNAIHNYRNIPQVIPLMLTAFGYAIVLPSIISYMNYERKILIYITAIGSSIPLIVYSLWQLNVAAPLFNNQIFLNNLNAINEPINFIANELIRITNNNFISSSAQLFSIFAILTSLVGVSLSLFNFSEDLLNQIKIIEFKNSIWQKLTLTFGPPFLFLLFNPSGFDKILSFAGIFVALLLGLLPIMMVWQVRNSHLIINLDNNNCNLNVSDMYNSRPNKHWQLPGGKILLIISSIFFILVILQELWNVFT